MITLRPQCPACDRRLAPIEAMRVATEQVQRRCWACGIRWRILVHPLPAMRGVVAMHELTYTEVSDVR